jgi:anti-sigma factor RsiW
MSDETRFSDEVLRDYAKGRLAQADAAALEAAAKTDPALAAEIALVKGVVKAGVADASRDRGSQLGWQRLSRAIDAEAGRSSSFLPTQFSRWQVAAAAALAVAFGALASIPLASRNGEAPEGYVMAGEQPAHAFSAQTTFVSTAQEGAIRDALLDANAKIVDGPSALGVYVLAFKDAKAMETGVASLRAQTGLVESVQPN